MKKISVILGSKSDMPQVESGLSLLKEFAIEYDLQVISAHRDPDKLKKYIKSLDKAGAKIIIACAGLSAALPGVAASHTMLPVIGVPLYSKYFKGIDSLLSILQMPKGMPVATVTVGSSGMHNAVLLAVRILSLNDSRLFKKLNKYKSGLKAK